MDMLIEDHLHNPIKALDVFSLSIQYLKDECIELFQKKHINVANDEILWILTVPAIWDESAKQFMRKAAEQVACISFFFYETIIFQRAFLITFWMVSICL